MEVAEFHIKGTSVQGVFQREDFQWNRISFGCNSLNSITKGGILTRGITEIYGESGVGKTQILLQLCLMVQTSRCNGGLSKGAVFICTENAFPSNRLYQLIGHFQKVYKEKIDFGQNIFVEHIIEMVFNCDGKRTINVFIKSFEKDALLQCIQERLPSLMQKYRIGLIVIDSIAAVLRSESNIVVRANTMRHVTANLLYLANKHKCAVVCANQISNILRSDGSSGELPCLGLAWTNLIRTRLRITKSQKQFQYIEEVRIYPLTIRIMQVLFSPDVKCSNAEFLILPKSGITDHLQ